MADDVSSVERGATIAAHNRRARIAASGAFAVQGLCFAGVLAQVPALRDRFGFDELQLSLILLAVPVVAGVGSLLAGALAKRTGSGILLRVGGVGVSGTVAAIGSAPTQWALFGAVGLFGLCVGVVDATMNMQGVAVQRRYGRSIMASCHAWWSVGGITGALATARTSSLDWSLELSMGAVGAAGVVLALAAGPWLLTGKVDHESVDRAGRSRHDPLPGQPNRAPVVWGKVTLIGLAVMVMFVGDASASNWSTVFIRDALDASAGTAPLGLAAYLAFQLLGRIVADRVIGWLGSMSTVIIGSLVAAAGFALVAAAPTPILAIAGFALIGLGLCVVVPISFSAADALDTTGTGVVVARVNLYNYAGFVVGAALVGLIAGVVGLRWAFVLPGALVLAIVALSPVFRVADVPRTRAARSMAAR